MCQPVCAIEVHLAVHLCHLAGIIWVLVKSGMLKRQGSCVVSLLHAVFSPQLFQIESQLFLFTLFLFSFISPSFLRSSLPPSLPPFFLSFLFFPSVPEYSVFFFIWKFFSCKYPETLVQFQAHSCSGRTFLACCFVSSELEARPIFGQ